MRALLILLLAASPAFAWEPAGPAEVQARIGELQQAWAGKTKDEVAQDKAARSRQKRPAWVDKSAWKLELGPLTYYFAVGKAAFGSGAPAASTSASGGGRALDWWFDESAGALYTLVVEAR